LGRAGHSTAQQGSGVGFRAKGRSGQGISGLGRAQGSGTTCLAPEGGRHCLARGRARSTPRCTSGACPASAARHDTNLSSAGLSNGGMYSPWMHVSGGFSPCGLTRGTPQQNILGGHQHHPAQHACHVMSGGGPSLLDVDVLDSALPRSPAFELCGIHAELMCPLQVLHRAHTLWCCTHQTLTIAWDAPEACPGGRSGRREQQANKHQSELAACLGTCKAEGDTCEQW
jgi:hypothetical protein